MTPGLTTLGCITTSTLKGIRELRLESTSTATQDGVLLLYTGRVSTDQVAGFGSSAKHPISRAIAAPYIKDMFKILQAEAEKQKSIQ